MQLSKRSLMAGLFALPFTKAQAMKYTAECRHDFKDAGCNYRVTGKAIPMSLVTMELLWANDTMKGFEPTLSYFFFKNADGSEPYHFGQHVLHINEENGNQATYVVTEVDPDYVRE